jgi:hypothetical protein
MKAPSVSVKDLHLRLGFENPLIYPDSSLNKPLTEWQMEIDDAPIFRYLYNNFRPKRHLEFGTWKGTGVLYCLEECDATVWTINLLQGETKSNGSWIYSNNLRIKQDQSLLEHLKSWYHGKAIPIPAWSQKEVFGEDGISYQTDSLGFIGRYYLEAGLGHRVCQIYCDSREWDIHNYPDGFFDSALIDGGHTEEIVANDTLKACQLVRPGGLILWHDFCEQVSKQCPSTGDVVKAIKRNWEIINDQMKDIFWIKPSWILLGVKK